MNEQQSEFAEQATPRPRQVPPPHTPLKQPREQQSCARVQATPSAEHTPRQLSVVELGSHLPLQHELLCVQLPVRWQVAGWTHVPPMQKREQHSSARVHAFCVGRHTDASGAVASMGTPEESRMDASAVPQPPPSFLS